MNTCTAELNTYEIDLATKRLGNFEKFKQEFIDGKELTVPDGWNQKNITKLTPEKVDKEILKLEKRIAGYKERDACNCPAGTAFLNIKSKNAAKGYRAARAGLPTAAITFGLTAIPYMLLESAYLIENESFPACFGKFTDMKKIQANWSGLDSLENVGMMKKLEELSINNNMVTSLEPLGTLKNLKRFSMKHNMFQDEKGHNIPIDAEPLSRIEGLEEVNLAHSSMTNIASLENVHGLKRVNLSYTGSTPNEMARIIASNENLEFIDATDIVPNSIACGKNKYKAGISIKLDKERIDALRPCFSNGTIEVK